VFGVFFLVGCVFSGKTGAGRRSFKTASNHRCMVLGKP
jgi:hypothetical protein